MSFTALLVIMKELLMKERIIKMEKCIVSTTNKRTGQIDHHMVAVNELIEATVNERHYYLRDIDGNPVATVAVIRRLKENDIGIGLAFCADMDNFSREEGKRRAYGRAERALKRKESSSPMNRSHVIEFIGSKVSPSGFNIEDPIDWVFVNYFKSLYIAPEEAEKCTFI
jgi:hypothetical protein